MSSIDHRVVEMRFNSAQFEKGVDNTLNSVQRLEEGLKLDGIASNVEDVSNKLSILGVVGFAALNRLANAAIDTGKKMASALIDPIVEGGKKRALNIEQARFQFEGLGLDTKIAMENALYAVKGTAYGLDEAASAASQLAASNVELGTEMENSLRGISGLAAMTNSEYQDIANIFVKVAGQGRLMGDDLNRIGARGINAAAMLAEAFDITEEELRKLVSEGKIGFQEFADAMDGAFGEQATKANDTFTGAFSNMRAALSRIGEMIWTPKHEKSRRFYNALTPVIDDAADLFSMFAGAYERWSKTSALGWERFFAAIDLSKLKRVVNPLVNIVETALRLAQNITKPIQQAFESIFLTDTADTIGNLSSWLWDIGAALRGMMPTAKTLNNIKSIFEGIFAAVDIGWMLVKGLAGVFGDLLGVIFGTNTGFLDFAATIGDWIVKLRDAIKEGEGFSIFLEKLTQILKAPIELLMAVGRTISDIFTGLFSADGFDGFADKVKDNFNPLGDLFTQLQKGWGRLGETLQKAWNVLKPFLETIIEPFKEFGRGLKDSFAEQNFSALWDIVNAGLITTLAVGVKRLVDSLTGFVTNASGMKSSITSLFDGVTETLSVMQSTLKAATLLQIAGAIGILAVAILILASIDPVDVATSLGAVAVLLTELMLALSTFTKVVSGKSLLLPVVAAGLVVLSVALVILTAAVRAMSDLEWDELFRGLTGLAGMIVGLVGATHLMKTKMFSMIPTAAGLVILAAAIRILTTAVKDLSEMSWSELGRGLAGVGALLGGLAIFTQLSKVSVRAVPQALGILILSYALGNLAEAVEGFAGMDWADIGRGLVAMAGGLAIMTAALAVMPATSIISSGALIIAVYALSILSEALKDMGSMSWGEIGKSLVLLLGSLALIAGGLYLMTAAIPGALALLIVAPALRILAQAMAELGDLSWGEIGRALTTLLGSLLILALGLTAMIVALPGAAAMVVVTVALAGLVPIMIALGNLSWGVIGKGLLALAGIFAVFGIAGLVLAPITPVLFALAGAILALGVAVLAAGAGVMFFAAGLGSLVALGTAGIKTLSDTVEALIELIPLAMEKLGEGVVAFAEAIANGSGAIVDAAVSIITDFLEGLEEVIPLAVDVGISILVALAEGLEERSPELSETGKSLLRTFLADIEEMSPEIAQTGQVVVMEFVNGIFDLAPLIANAGMTSLQRFLMAIRARIPTVVELAVDIIVAFIKGIGDEGPRIIEEGKNTVIKLAEGVSNSTQELVDAGFDLIIDFVNGLTKTINQRMPEIRAAGLRLAIALADGMTGGLASKTGELAAKAVNMVSTAYNSAKNFLGIASPSKLFYEMGGFTGEGMALGIESMYDDVGRSSAGMGETAVDRLRHAMLGIPDVLEDVDWDSDPIITPVLDLSDVDREAQKLADMLSGATIDADLNYAQARGIVSEEASRRSIDPESDISKTEITYNQNNYSPKALSSADIYRQTKNQISTLKKGGPVNAN